ncbi:MAG TPA: DUF3109 family protein [Bacteroidota bacterium]
MVVIAEVMVDPSVATTNFSCDLTACHGACCCTAGGRGAALEDEEILEVEKAYSAVEKYLSEKHRNVLQKSGLYVGCPGDYTTLCVEGRECVFVTYEGPIAKCALEKAFVNGETSWRKPISCHLFPLRLRKSGKDLLWYEWIPECIPAVKRGDREGIPLTGFLREALVRKYGVGWYEQLSAAVSAVRHNDFREEASPNGPTYRLGTIQ